MGRKKSDSLIDICFDVAAAIPWWLGFILAGTTYWVFHYFALQEVPVMQGADPMKNPTPMLTGSIFKAVLNVLQYLLPLAFVFGAVASFVKSLKARRLYRAAVAQPHSIANMCWREFEDLIGEVFRQQGYQVHQKGGAGSDGGIDLILKRDANKYLVQCKHWKKGKVGVTVVRELLGVMTAQQARGGIVVASENFTQEAEAFAKANRIKLIGGRELTQLLKQAQARVNGESPSAATLNLNDNPICPQCGSDMVNRMAKKGERAGQMFWGCSRYPSCKGIINR